MNRRDAIAAAAQAFVIGSVVPGFLRGCGGRSYAAAGNGKIFYVPAMQPTVRANAKTPLLLPTFESWKEEGHTAIYEAIERLLETGDILVDMRNVLEAMTRQSVVQIVEPNADREEALMQGVRTMIDLPKWDYFLEGGIEVIGIMRSSMAVARLLFVRDVLELEGGETDASLLQAIADKGCQPCAATLRGMDDPDSVVGWAFDENHQSVYEIDLSRWPEILGANNLRAIPTMGLGLGALALRGHDDRADTWLQTAEQSTRTFLGFISPDGSYFEGISYIDYALRTLLGFIDAHQRLDGTVDWTSEMNLPGILRFILAMQAGEASDGQPDVVNFSDSRKSVFPCIPSWIQQQTGSGLAQFAAESVSQAGYYLDFLWYRPGESVEKPGDDLKNARLDLGWIISRTGWAADDAVLAFRSGGPANHEHADRNSFLYKTHGERLLTDQFGAAYDWRQPAWLLRLTKGHNAVLINGRGHQYHDGEEGTNESQASAEITAYQDEGDRISWTSDATQAYALVDPEIESVVRTVVFAKPDVIIIRDYIRTSQASNIEVRFFPDNRDGNAGLETADGSFVMTRPRASLAGYIFGHGDTSGPGMLDLPDELGSFPFVAIESNSRSEHEVVSVLVARRDGDDTEPQLHLFRADDGWMFEVNNISGQIETVDVPHVSWFS